VASLIYGIIMHFLSMNISMYAQTIVSCLFLCWLDALVDCSNNPTTLHSYSISCLIMVAMVSFDFHFQIAYFWMRDKGTRTSRLMNVVTQIGTPSA
jgi:hypothetical protein